MQDWWLETVIRGVAGPRFSMSSYSTSLLCTVRWFMYSGKRSQSQVLGHFHLPEARKALPYSQSQNPRPGQRPVNRLCLRLWPLTGPEAAVGAN